MKRHPAAAVADLAEILSASGQTTVNYADDPSRPGRTFITIQGPTRLGVQAQIDKACAATEAEDVTLGMANFDGPFRTKDGWGAMGEVIIQRVPA